MPGMRKTIIALCAVCVCFGTALASLSIVRLPADLSHIDIILVATVRGIEQRTFLNQTCGSVVKLEVSERLTGLREVVEIGSMGDLEVGRKYIFFLRRGRGAFTPDGFVSYEPDVAQLRDRCLASLPPYSAEHRLTGQFGSLESDEIDRILDLISGEQPETPTDILKYVSVSEQVILPDSLLEKAISFELETVNVDSQQLTANGARKVVPTNWLMQRGRFLPWADYRFFLLQEI